MIRRKVTVELLGMTLLVLFLAMAACAQGIQVTSPVSGAIVREAVKFYVDPSDLPGEGYASIDIDGTFASAQVLPDNVSDPVFIWDTKAGYTNPSDPSTKQYVQDGPHSITISIFGTGNKLVGTETVNVNVANKIHIQDNQGVTLSYNWHEGDEFRYSRQTKLEDVTGGAHRTLQASSIKYMRVVEDVSEDEALIRDKVLAGTVINQGSSMLVQTAFNLKSFYRDVTDHGTVRDNLPPLTPGDHFGFSIPTLPARRVSIGDSWVSPIEISLKWASDRPATILAEARLEDFEWQDRYPTARFRETYSGPVTFISSDGKTPVRVNNIDFERVVYFAYNSSRLIKTVTTISIPGSLTSDQVADLSGDNQTAPAVSAGPGQGEGGNAGGPPPGSVPQYGGGPPPGSIPQYGGGGPGVVIGHDPMNGAPIYAPSVGAAPAEGGGPGDSDNGGGTPTGTPLDLEFTENSDILTNE